MDGSRFNSFEVNFSSQTSKGKRKYMEDVTFVDINSNTRSAFFGVFDGHGGPEAAKYAAKHLWPNICEKSGFSSDDPKRVKKAIKEGFMSTHWDMWRAVDTWPKRETGHSSTSGTTATVAIVKGRRLYVAHVGDSAAVMGFTDSSQSDDLKCSTLTRDHKPDTPDERKRIRSLGGKVAVKKGIARVVWKRPQAYGNGPRRRSCQYEEVPFLAVSRSLGDFWSYDAEKEEFLVSPEPEVAYHELVPGRDRVLVLGSDGLFGIMTPEEIIQFIARYPDQIQNQDSDLSGRLVDEALKKWSERKMRADNVSAIVVSFIPIEVEEPDAPLCCLSRSTSKTSTIVSDTEDVNFDESPPISTVGSDASDIYKPGLVRTMAFCYRDGHDIVDKGHDRSSLAMVLDHEKLINGFESGRVLGEDETSKTDKNSLSHLENNGDSTDDFISGGSIKNRISSEDCSHRTFFPVASKNNRIECENGPKPDLVQDIATMDEKGAGDLTNSDLLDPLSHEMDVSGSESDANCEESSRKRKSPAKMFAVDVSSSKRPRLCSDRTSSCNLVTSVSPESVRLLEYGSDYSLVDISSSSPLGIPITPPQRKCIMSDG